jgi:hypothetical protein
MILNRLGEDAPARVVTVPLVVRGRSVAVLYADSAELDAEAINLEALETLVRVAGMAVELLVARSAPASEAAAPAPAPEAPPLVEAPAYTPVAEYDEITPVVEESAPPAPAAEVEEPPPVEAVVEPPAPVEAVAPVPFVIEEPAPPVEIVVEPIAPVVEAPARRRYGADVELPVPVGSEEERRLHNDARRFARLLVSEIKLYNEQKVIEGRSQNDLYYRLREYIDRSREMYDKRVKPEVAQKYDYFHSELVTTLAEGDEAKLGSAYPGATVSA